MRIWTLIHALGRLHSIYVSYVSVIIFWEIPGTKVPFIRAVISLLSIIALTTGITVFNDSNREPLPPTTPLPTQLLTQAKEWRNQRNLYLTCLALSLWFSVAQIFSYQQKVAELEAKEKARKDQPNDIVPSVPSSDPMPSVDHDDAEPESSKLTQRKKQ